MELQKQDIRPMPVNELIIQKNYLELVPRPSPEDYNRIKESMKKHGWDSARPAVANEDGVVLDGMTRVQIAKELNIEWAKVTIKDFGDDLFEEKKYVITVNLDRRHFTSKQKVELAEKLIEIRKEEARVRQLNNLKQYEKDQESGAISQNAPRSPNIGGTVDKHSGEAMAHTARDIGIGRETLRKGLKVKEAARKDPEIAAAWENKTTSINQSYQQLKEKERVQKSAQGKKAAPEPQPIEHMPEERIRYWLYKVADEQGLTREEIEGAIQEDRDLLMGWDWALRGIHDLKIEWDLTLFAVRMWREKQRAAQPQEVPVPENARKLGPWALDYVHQAELRNLVGDFPAESVHMIYSETVADLEQVGLLAEFASRVLRQGKYLCLYVDKGSFPEALARLSASGLIYSWTCVAYRPGDKVEVPGRMIREKSRILLIYRQPGTAEAEWDWFNDAEESRNPANRELARQVINGLTTQGQLIVDPFVSSGITGKVALSLGRRFLCFGADAADVRAANQRLSQVRLADATT